MQRLILFCGTAIITLLLAVSVTAQDKLEGKWEGMVKSMRGDRPATVNFKKEGDKYTGNVSGMRDGQFIDFKEIKVEGDQISAIAEVETPQGGLTISYKFKLQGEAMTGQGSVDFGGNAFTFDYELKRGGAASAATAAPAAPRGAQQQRRTDVPQPQQDQSPDYFVGQWNFKYIGRESALGPAPREGIITFTKNSDGKTLTAVTEGKSENGAYKETATAVWDEKAKTLTFTEKLANGVQLSSKGDWSSPIAIRFAIDPVKVKGQSVQLRRTLSVVAAHSFTVTEELSEDGGPFVRLGNAIFSKVGAK